MCTPPHCFATTYSCGLVNKIVSNFTLDIEYRHICHCATLQVTTHNRYDNNHGSVSVVSPCDEFPQAIDGSFTIGSIPFRVADYGSPGLFRKLVGDFVANYPRVSCNLTDKDLVRQSLSYKCYYILDDIQVQNLIPVDRFREFFHRDHAKL